jgi:hypothetical protein
MPISLQSFAESGETAYIGKHNANVAALLSFLGSVESSLANVSGSASGLGNAANIGKATYGTTSAMSLIGTGSFADSLPNVFTLNLTGGFAWDGSLGIMNYKAGSTDLVFSGMAANTYYIRFDGSSNPYIGTIAAGAIYSVVWGGAEITTVTQLATVTPNAPDIADLSNSLYSGISYLDPKERLEATEKAFSAFYTASMASGDFTPTVAQIMESIGVKLTGALTTSNRLNVPAKAKVLLVRNECTTANGSTVTVKTTAGTGVTLLAGEHAVLYCDGTNVLQLYRQGAANTITSIGHLDDVPDSYTGLGLRLLRVRGDELGMEYVDPVAVLTPNLAVQEEGVEAAAAVSTMNFAGAGVSVSSPGAGQILVTIPGGGGADLAVQDEGVQVDAATVLLNFQGDGVTVTQTASGQLLITIPGAGSAAVDYDVSLYIADKRPSGSVAFRHTFTKAVNFAANFALSDSDAVAAATALSVFLVKKNGAQVGTITFAAASSVGVFATTGAATVSFLAGGILEITAPSPQDSTLSGVSITLAGVRA